MASASYPYSSYRQPAPFRRRVASVILALIVNALIVLVLLGIANLPALKPKPKYPPVFVQINADDSSTATNSSSATKHRAGGAKPSQKSQVHPKQVILPPPPVELPASAAVMPPGFIRLTREEYAASDIGKMEHHPAGPGNELASKGNGDATEGGARSVGTAPNGEMLYVAEWYRRPTNAELDPYLPKHGPQQGVGLIACRTAERYHVEDCQELASSPPGSGFARAVREAAWQFLVRPPRLGGKPQIGTWVRIEITYGVKGVETD